MIRGGTVTRILSLVINLLSILQDCLTNIMYNKLTFVYPANILNNVFNLFMYDTRAYTHTHTHYGPEYAAIVLTMTISACTVVP
jgi:hypothetical protein